MEEKCTHDCSTCKANCSERQSMIENTNEMSAVKKIIAIVSGKGGVGKSLVTSLLAVNSQRNGFKTAILDADMTGPSIPKAFNIHEKAKGDGRFMFPLFSKTGIGIMSLNLLLKEDTDPVVWRGPAIAGAVKQFWTDVIWNDIDFMFIDMPPGTGDVPLTVFQSIPVDGIIVVSTPQELVSIIVEKSVNMAKAMNIPIIGMVENMSYFKCSGCGEKHEIFGKSRAEEQAKKYGVESVARIPMDKALTSCADKGVIELYEGDWLDDISERLAKMLD